MEKFFLLDLTFYLTVIWVAHLAWADFEIKVKLNFQPSASEAANKLIKMHCRVRDWLDFDLKIRSGQVCIRVKSNLYICLIKSAFHVTVETGCIQAWHSTRY